MKINHTYNKHNSKFIGLTMYILLCIIQSVTYLDVLQNMCILILNDLGISFILVFDTSKNIQNYYYLLIIYK